MSKHGLESDAKDAACSLPHPTDLLNERNTMTTIPEPNEWVKRLESPGTTLLEPFTSEATRTDGKQLVLISIVTILLSMDLLKVTKGSAGPLTIEPTEYLNVVFLAGAACTYFLLIYGFSLYRDKKASFYKRLPAIVEHRRLQDENVQIQNQRYARHEYLQDEISKLLEVRKQKLAEIDTEAASRTTLPSATEPDKLEEELERRADAFRLRQERWEAFDAHCKADGLDALQNENLALAFDNTLPARAEALYSVLETTKRLDTWRFWAEVIFPCALSMLAIARSILWLLH